MRRQHAALASIAIGVLLFFLGLFGRIGELSFMLAGCGLLVALMATPALIYISRPHRLCPPHFGVILVSALAAALHAYAQLFYTSGDAAIGFFLWAMAPYGLALSISVFPRLRTAAIAGAVAAFAFDLFTYHSVVTSTSSTAALAYVFAPLWNVLVWVPLLTYAASAVALPLKHAAQREVRRE